MITGDIPAGVTALREQPGNDITTGASGTLARCLPWERRAPSACPVFASTGKRLFERGGRQVPRSLLTELAREAGAPDPVQLGRQLHLLYDGGIIAARMDRDPAIAADAKAAAERLLADLP